LATFLNFRNRNKLFYRFFKYGSDLYFRLVFKLKIKVVEDDDNVPNPIVKYFNDDFVFHPIVIGDDIVSSTVYLDDVHVPMGHEFIWEESYIYIDVSLVLKMKSKLVDVVSNFSEKFFIGDVVNIIQFKDVIYMDNFQSYEIYYGASEKLLKFNSTF